ncbi:HET-domain-containing protein [Venturia nashicola]|nr:HET-domain-containing protein [Venturia nashicola]
MEHIESFVESASNLAPIQEDTSEYQAEGPASSIRPSVRVMAQQTSMSSDPIKPEESEDEPPISPLCKSCQRIDFALLRGPRTSEIPMIRDANIPDQYSYTKNAEVRLRKIVLGFLSDIKERIECSLCELISQLISDTGVYTEDCRAHSGARVICKADIGKETGIFRYPEKDADNNVKLFQLTITTHLEGHQSHDLDGSAHLYLDNRFLVCDYGSSLIQIGDDFQDPRSDVDMTLFAGRMRPLQINLAWLRRWLEICEDEHQDTCSIMLSKDHVFEMPWIRFIDIEQRCVRTFRQRTLRDFRYIALSYVWGSPSKDSASLSLQLDSLTSLLLHTPGSLDRLDLPQTIVDVLDLAKALDIPYVWIDRLCICQDSIEDKTVQISKMHAIYYASFVTVIGAAGVDVSAGLPGLRQGTRHRIQQEVLVSPPCRHDCAVDHVHDRTGLSLLTALAPFIRTSNYMDGTVWNKRGWTMQERVLSRRNLIFTNELVQFVCSETKFTEEAYFEFPFPQFQSFERSSGELRLKSSVRVFTEPTDATERFWRDYGYFVEKFSLRTLSYAGDYHDAFAAITEALSVDAGEEFLSGLPISRFELALSWITFLGQDRREELTTLPMTDLKQQVSFPSWSWMGWVGQTHIIVGSDRLETETPTIRCYVHQNISDGVRLIEVAGISSKGTQLPEEMFWEPEKNRQVDLDVLRLHLPGLDTQLKYIPSHHIIFFWASHARFQVSTPSDGTEKLRLDEPDLGFICIDCHTVQQHLSGTDASVDNSAGKTSPPNILDAAGHVVGSLSRMDENFWKRGCYNEGLQDFIVVGRRHIAELGDEYPATLLVMQIERRDGIWYRLNMGEISESAWDTAVREWTLIALG